jgi:N-acetylglucosamine-6-sulfatase
VGRRAVRSIVGVVSLSLVALMALVACSSDDSNPSAGEDRPNIVFILADDLDSRLLADNAASFPAFQRLLADEGMSFTNYFVSDSLCCPSRATTLRGQYDHNTGVPGNAGPEGG